jgi:hypothetical protein
MVPGRPGRRRSAKFHFCATKHRCPATGYPERLGIECEQGFSPYHLGLARQKSTRTRSVGEPDSLAWQLLFEQAVLGLGKFDDEQLMPMDPPRDNHQQKRQQHSNGAPEPTTATRRSNLWTACASSRDTPPQQAPRRLDFLSSTTRFAACSSARLAGQPASRRKPRHRGLLGASSGHRRTFANSKSGPLSSPAQLVPDRAARVVEQVKRLGSLRSEPAAVDYRHQAFREYRRGRDSSRSGEACKRYGSRASATAPAHSPARECLRRMWVTVI